MKTITAWATTALISTLSFTSPALSRGREVLSTVYHPWFNGRTTACGNTYQHWGISAAHPWLPCNTKVTVTHRGRSLVVPITDSCDCNALDLSAGAAYRLGVPLDGTAVVRISH